MTTQQVAAWLDALGLGEYAETFQEQQIDLSVLPTLTEADLKELGVPMGHRKRLLAAIAALGQPAAGPASATDALAPLIAGLPTPLALPLRDYQQETHPVLKLWAACDAVEILLRVLVFLGIGDLSRRGGLPEQLRRELRYPIENPMLGNWRRMAQQVAEALPEDTALPELVPLVRETLVPFLDGPDGARSVERSFLALRNRLAHGGGISRRLATELLATWQTPFEAIWPHLAWLAELDLVVRRDVGYSRLRGPSETPEPCDPAVPEVVSTILADAGPIAAIRGDQVIPLWPLALFGIPQHPERGPDPAGQPLPQVYVRRGEVNLEYTPLGGATLPQSESDETAVERFLALFRAPQSQVVKAQKGFSVAGFEESFSGLAKNLRGRTGERETLRAALAQVSSGILWLDGPAGMGKSYLMADLAHDLLTHPRDDTLVLGYQFRASDPRCGREPFLRFAIERLQAWLPAVEGEEEDETLKDPDRFKALLARLGERRVLFLLDGLDEIAERDPRFATDLPLGIQGPTLTWLCAGRPERGLSEAFAAAGALRVFPDGLPPMHAGDIRTLLLERIGPLRKKLLRQDTEEGERVGNPFVDKVARLSEGLPLYVKYVIDDIHAGRYRVLDAGEALPPGLHAYHEELLRRLSIGSLHQVLTPIAATLAVAKEPLAAPALADLLRRRGRLVPEGDAGLRLAQQGLSAVASMLRRARTPEGEEGFTLYHHSLAQHMAESAHCRIAVATAREFLADLADAIPEGPLAPYLFRRGINHLLDTGRVPAALALLTRFDYLMARLQALKDPDGVQGIGGDWLATLAANPEQDRDTKLWEAFWREREHILRRGDERWPAYKILLQLAVEHADDSPVTRDAEAWLEAGKCDWIWLRSPRRMAHVLPDPCLRVLEGHTGAVNGALRIPDGRILSWSADHTLRLWDGRSGAPLATLTGHTKSILGAHVLGDGRILSWSEDCTLRLWDGQTGKSQATLTGHTGAVNGALLLPDGRIFSWSADQSLRLWDGQTGESQAALKGHTGPVYGATLLPDGNFLSWSHDCTLRLWEGLSGALRVTFLWQSPIVGAEPLPDGRFLSWSDWSDPSFCIWDQSSVTPVMTLGEGSFFPTGAHVSPNGPILTWSRASLCLWDDRTGLLLAALPKQGDIVLGATILGDSQALSWDQNGKLFLWDTESQTLLATLSGHSKAVRGIQLLCDRRILSWSKDGTLRLWMSNTGTPLATLAGHTGPISGAAQLPDERILSWSKDGSLRLWDAAINGSLVKQVGHRESVVGVKTLDDGRLVSWSRDGDLRLWDESSGTPLKVLSGHTEGILGAQVLSDRCALSWAEDNTLRLWDLEKDAQFAILQGHNGTIFGAEALPDGERILSWSADGTLRVWNRRSGALLATLAKHTSAVWGAGVLPDGERILSWSQDRTLRVWDAADGALLAILAGHTDEVVGARMLPDGRIVSWSADKTLRLWDSLNGTLLATLAGHSHLVAGADVLADGRIISWSWDGTLRLWDGHHGSLLATLRGHSGIDHNQVFIDTQTRTPRLKVSPQDTGALELYDGRIMSWFTHDRTVRLWNSRCGSPVADPIIIEELPWRLPEVLYARTKMLNEVGVFRRTAGWSVAKTAGVTTLATSCPPICWQGNSKIETRILLSAGILVVTQDSGEVSCLQIHCGQRRINVAEYENPVESRSD